MSASPEFLTYLEMNYWISPDGTYPSLDEISAHFDIPVELVKAAIREALPALQGRGLVVTDLETMLEPKHKEITITVPPVSEIVAANKNAAERLDPVFVNAVRIIVDNVDKRSTGAKLKALGITTSQWKAFLRRKANNDYFQAELNKSFHNDVETSLKLSLGRNVEAGDLQSMKFWAEYTGKYRPDSEILINLGVILGKIMEILSTKLSQDDFIEVAESLESLMLSETRELTA